MATPTSGMKRQQDRNTQAILELQGDLKAIQLLNERACLRANSPSEHYEGPEILVSYSAKRILWNAKSRLISRVTATLGITNPNSRESVLARELVGLASRGIEI